MDLRENVKPIDMSTLKKQNRLFSYTWADGQTHTQPVVRGNFLSVSALAYRLASVAPLAQRLLLQWWNHWRLSAQPRKQTPELLCCFWSRRLWIQYSLRWDRQYEKANSKERRFAQKWEARASSSQTVFTQTQVAYTIHFPDFPIGWLSPRCCPGWWMGDIGCGGEALSHWWDVTGPIGNTHQGCTWSYPSWPGTHTNSHRATN